MSDILPPELHLQGFDLSRFEAQPPIVVFDFHKDGYGKPHKVTISDIEGDVLANIQGRADQRLRIGKHMLHICNVLATAERPLTITQIVSSGYKNSTENRYFRNQQKWQIFRRTEDVLSKIGVEIERPTRGTYFRGQYFGVAITAASHSVLGR